jgi:hypothetical protein
MKQVSILLLLSLLVVSCSKPESTPTSTANFVINGLRDVDLTVTSNGSYSYPISIVSTTGSKDTVTLFGDQFPDGLYPVFEPDRGITPFNSILTIATDFSGAKGGTFPVTISGSGKSGTRSYTINVKLDPYRGWQLGSTIYEKVALQQFAGSATKYASITVKSATGADLFLSFAMGAGLPIANGTYKVSGDTGRKNIQIAMYEGAHIWNATGKFADGTEGASGVFTFDTLRKFTFKCANVEMTDGVNKMPLSCSFSE